MLLRCDSRFLRFCCIGGLGFVIDSSLTYAFVALGMDPFAARIPAVLVAMTICYHLHHGFTFQKQGNASWSGWYRFALTNGLGNLINYGAYAGLLLVWSEVPLIVPLVVGSGAAMVANYIMSVCYVFR